MIYKDNYEINSQNTSRYLGYSLDNFVHFSDDIRNELFNRYIELLVDKIKKEKRAQMKVNQEKKILLDNLMEIISREEEKKEKIKRLIRR